MEAVGYAQAAEIISSYGLFSVVKGWYWSSYSQYFSCALHQCSNGHHQPLAKAQGFLTEGPNVSPNSL